MSTTKQDAAGNNDELDLVEFIRNILLFIKSYGKILIGLSLVGILAGGLTYMTIPKSYSSKLFVQPVHLNKQEEFQIINSWTELMQRGQKDVLAQQFKCRREMLDRVNSITAEEIPKVSTLNSNGFIIRVSVKDTGVLDELQKAIINGFENNEYISQRMNIKVSNLKQLITRVTVEMQKLDSLKTHIESNIAKGNGSSYMVNISNINSEIVGLNEKKLSYEEELKFSKGIIVLQSFTKNSKPDQPKLKALLALGLIAGLFIGAMIILFRVLKKKYPELF